MITWQLHLQAMAGMKPETLARVQVYKEPIDFKALFGVDLELSLFQPMLHLR